MPIPSGVQAVFGHFQSLNLLALLHDLRAGRTARHAWLSGSLLCPIAHGLPSGPQVRRLSVLGQGADLRKGCLVAAQHLGTETDDVVRFVRDWDEGTISAGWLLRQLEAVWSERLADAQAFQDVMQSEPMDADDAEGLRDFGRETMLL